MSTPEKKEKACDGYVCMYEGVKTYYIQRTNVGAQHMRQPSVK